MTLAISRDRIFKINIQLISVKMIYYCHFVTPSPYVTWINMICVTWTRQRASVNMALNIYFSFRLISSRWLRLRLVTIRLLIWTIVRWSIMFDFRLEHHHNSGSNWFKIFKNLQTEKFSFLLHVKLQNQKVKALLHFHCKNLAER